MNRFIETRNNIIDTSFINYVTEDVNCLNCLWIHYFGNRTYRFEGTKREYRKLHKKLKSFLKVQEDE